MEGNFDKYWRMEVSFSPENNCSNGDKVCPAHIFLLSVSLGEAHRNCRAAVFQHGCRSGCLQHKSGLWQPRQWVSHLSLLKRTCHGACSCPQPLATVSWDLLQCYCWGHVLSALLQLLSDHDGVARVEPFLISSGICSLAVFALWCPLGMVETFAELHCSVRLSYSIFSLFLGIRSAFWTDAKALLACCRSLSSLFFTCVSPSRCVAQLAAGDCACVWHLLFEELELTCLAKVRTSQQLGFSSFSASPLRLYLSFKSRRCPLEYRRPFLNFVFFKPWEQISSLNCLSLKVLIFLISL